MHLINSRAVEGRDDSADKHFMKAKKRRNAGIVRVRDLKSFLTGVAKSNGTELPNRRAAARRLLRRIGPLTRLAERERQCDQLRDYIGTLSKWFESSEGSGEVEKLLRRTGKWAVQVALVKDMQSNLAAFENEISTIRQRFISDAKDIRSNAAVLNLMDDQFLRDILPAEPGDSEESQQKIKSVKQYKPTSEMRALIHNALFELGRDATSERVAEWIDEKAPYSVPTLTKGACGNQASLASCLRQDTELKSKFEKDYYFVCGTLLDRRCQPKPRKRGKPKKPSNPVNV